MTTQMTEAEHQAAGDLYGEQVRAFIAHAAVAGVGVLITFAVNLATNAAAGILGEWGAWWSIWAFIGWGAGLAVHGLVVWLNRPTSPTS